eukprot:scaffold19061_cov31-Tisochrysis_lutea.AAC.2
MLGELDSGDGPPKAETSRPTSPPSFRHHLRCAKAPSRAMCAPSRALANRGSPNVTGESMAQLTDHRCSKARVKSNARAKYPLAFARRKGAASRAWSASAGMARTMAPTQPHSFRVTSARAGAKSSAFILSERAAEKNMAPRAKHLCE